MTLRAAAAGLLTCALLATLFGCAPQDDAARAHAAGETRIAALSPAIGLILTDLGLADRIVARHAFDPFLPRSIPAAGDQAGIDYERLLAVHPTHVLLEWGQRPLPAQLTALARRRAWRVESFRLLSLDDVRMAAQRLGELFAVGRRAEAALRDFDEALRVDPVVREELGRTLILYFVDPIAAAGPASALWQVASSLGAASALPPHASAFVNLDAEDLLALQPDSILIAAPGAEADKARKDPLAFAGPIARLPLRAVRLGKVGVVVHPAALSASLRLREVALEIRDIASRFAVQEAVEAGAAATGGT